MTVVPLEAALAAGPYDLVVVGTGFASTFFLTGWLEKARDPGRILVIERGRHDTHAWRVANRRYASIDHESTFRRSGRPDKEWTFTVAFGGSSNCWTGNVPRLLPSDFRLRSLYGVGDDWPIGYDDLAPHYDRVEAVMEVSGPERTPFPRSGPYPQPPHRPSEPDRIMAAAWPDHYFTMPTARARVATAHRPPCCASGVCGICPVNAKFTLLNDTADLFDDPRLTVVLETEALAVETAAGRATGVRLRHAGREQVVPAALVVLGANAIFNAHLLLASGDTHPLVGRRLHEQVGVEAEVFLDGVDNFQGSTFITGHGYMLYDGPHRREHAACLMEFHNVGRLRADFGKWRQVLPLRLVFEDLPQERNRVLAPDDGSGRPIAHFEGHSDYADRGIAAAEAALPRVLAALPVERIEVRKPVLRTEAHIQGTVMMGDDPATSVVDRTLVHHAVRNLVVLGSSAFPSCSPANPTLTLSALSLWSAAHLA